MERTEDVTTGAQTQAGRAPGTCHKHPHALAVERCPACHAAICEYCVTPVGDAFLCRDCARSRRTRRRLAAGVVVVAILGAIGLVGWLAAGALRVADTGRIAKGQHKGRRTDAQLQALAIAQDPCNEKKIKAWVTDQAGGDCDKVLARAQFFFDRCGPYLRLRWATFGCYKARGDHDRAIAEVNRLIGEWPYDKDFRWWRGEVYARKKDWRRALDDYWQSIVLSPAMRGIPFDLSVQAHRARQPCRAVFPMLQHAYYHPEWKLDPDERKDRLRAMQACPDTLGIGTVTGPMAAGGEAPPLSVRVNGKAAGDFSMDLETGLTMVSRDYADKLGLPRGKPFLAWYGDQLQSGHLVTLEKVDWGDARAAQVEALVIQSPPFFTDGVLGRTFLLRFNGRFDKDHTHLSLKPRTFHKPLAPPPPDPGPAPDPDLHPDLDPHLTE